MYYLCIEFENNKRVDAKYPRFAKSTLQNEEKMKKV